LIEEGILDYQATGAVLRLPYFFTLKAEALHLAEAACRGEPRMLSGFVANPDPAAAIGVKISAK
jgi:hypothetical protein